MGVALSMSTSNRRFSGCGVWFIHDKFAFMGNFIIKTGHWAGSYGQYKMQTSYKMQTEYKMRTRYKMQTADRVQNADCRRSTKCSLGAKWRLTRKAAFFRQKHSNIRL